MELGWAAQFGDLPIISTVSLQLLSCIPVRLGTLGKVLCGRGELQVAPCAPLFVACNLSVPRQHLTTPPERQLSDPACNRLLTGCTSCRPPYYSNKKNPQQKPFNHSQQIVDWVYELLSKLRMPMGRGMDAVLAMRRMKMTSEVGALHALRCTAAVWAVVRAGLVS